MVCLKIPKRQQKISLKFPPFNSKILLLLARWLHQKMSIFGTVIFKNTSKYLSLEKFERTNEQKISTRFFQQTLWMQKSLTLCLNENEPQKLRQVFQAKRKFRHLQSSQNDISEVVWNHTLQLELNL